MCFNHLIRRGALYHRKVFPSTLLPIIQVRYVEKDPPGEKKPAKVEQIDKLNMPGFIHPENMNEEGYFTQKAKHQIEELKKRVDKPKVEHTEKKDD